MDTGSAALAAMVFEVTSRGSLTARYDEINALLDQGARAEALAAWDIARREHAAWALMGRIRYQQDTQSADAKAGREEVDALAPVAVELDVSVKRRLLAHEDRVGLERDAGAHAVRLWEADVTTFVPKIADRLEEEARLTARYTELTSSARLEIEGELVNLSGLSPYSESLDRDVRRRAAKVMWDFFARHGDELDSLYDRLITLRHSMAVDLGHENFIPLIYRKMRRIDYGPDDVARYRDEVVEHVVPLMARILEDRRREHGWDQLYAWDLPLMDPGGNPKPLGGHDDLVEAGKVLFDRIDRRVGELYRTMHQDGYLDLETRPTKAPGGFCETFATTGMPFIFANFNGTVDDIQVLTHEMGHAAQLYESRHLPSFDYLEPTAEAAEITSMTLEMLCLPHAGLLVGDASAGRLRRMHLISTLAVILICALADHFQHEIYARPQISPVERHDVWRTLAGHYSPWENWGDLEHPSKGGAWHSILHLFLTPFYTIDYALAQCCALQFWTRSQENQQSTLDDYLALCARGGSAPFGELVRSAGLISPFTPGALASSVRAVEEALYGPSRKNANA